jgi:hypothetical protein
MQTIKLSIIESITNVIVGLITSSNIENFLIRDCPKVYDFHKEYQNAIIEKYKTINKSICGNQLWQQVIKEE